LTPIPGGGAFLKKGFAPLTLKERDFKEHRHFVTFWDDRECLFHELKGEGIRRVSDYVTIPLLSPEAEKILHLAKATVNEVTTGYIIPMFQQHF
jgi:hypothetical protein